MGRPDGGKLTIYVDCGSLALPVLRQSPFSELHAQLTPAVSPYSWFGFTNTIRFRPLLNSYGVSVDIIPFFLGAARDGAGNPFSPTPAAKQPFAKQDTETTGRLLGLKVVPPKVFPILSLFVSRVFLRYGGDWKGS